MNKQILTFALLTLLSTAAWAQRDYRISKTNGKLIINLQGARIEGYDGSEIIFSKAGAAEKEDERAKGLQVLSSTGLKDNTGLGISVVEKDGNIEVFAVGNQNDKELLRIRVPRQMGVIFHNDNSFMADSLLIKGIRGEIEVSTSYNKVRLEGNSGPMNVKSVYNGVEAVFNPSITGPISIVSVYGHVDVSLPAATKATLSLSTSYGKLYAAEAFDVKIPPKSTAEKNEVSTTAAITDSAAETIFPEMPPIPPTPPVFIGSVSEQIEGSINGGGIHIILKSSYENVYLRTSS
ncbi:hypothetical protein [Parapedobacter indicus]|uniref:Adhesin domain-containing protein n=1 Tax=Parapedobacter indicus TaxID=1477437 RepID=A0A1I3K6G4_9SPHI|nr:hypothetical protein [Parapedobacter indicus]PPL01722.1 hypothetical protein CLV26_105100 [Parapedobacter indicus]SFI67890.1 hypothetical protein SAMN05444682_105100 [Parapedobacter indicus]